MKETRAVWLLGAGALLLYAVTAPSVVNGDGLGYLRPLKWSVAPKPVPGHLLYIPLLRILRWLTGGHTLEAARLVNALAGAGSVLLAYRLFRSLIGDHRRALLGAAGLAASWGLWGQACDVETYALALVATLSAATLMARWQARPSPGLAAAVGLAAAAATLFHVTHVLFFVCVLVWLRRRRAHALLACATGAFTVAATYAIVAFAVLRQTPAQAWSWFRGAGHGFVYLIRPYNLTDSLQGLARSLVHAPYVHEADPAVVIGQLLLGAAALAALVLPPILGRDRLPDLPRAALWAWALPYALLGFLFFGTDPERWIFVLPLLWLLFSAAAAERLARALAGGLFALNLITAALPGMTEIGPRWRARAVESVLEPNDLVIMPGHDWDEYIGFYDERYVRVFPLAYYVGVYGVGDALVKLQGTIDAARAKQAQVYLVRILGEDAGSRGWDELRLIDFPQARAAAWFQERFATTRLEPVRGVQVYRLEGRLEAPQKSEAGSENTLEKPR